VGPSRRTVPEEGGARVAEPAAVKLDRAAMRSLPNPYTLGERIALLAGCSAAGASVGFFGSSLSGNDYWYLALPLLVVVGWILVANPGECEPPKPPSANVRSGDFH